MVLQWCPKTSGSEWREADKEKERDKWEMKVIANRIRTRKVLNGGLSPAQDEPSVKASSPPEFYKVS